MMRSISLAAHIRAQGVFFQRLFAERRHRQVDEHLMAGLCALVAISRACGAFGSTATEMVAAAPAPDFRLWTIAKSSITMESLPANAGAAKASMPATARAMREIEAKLIFPTTAVD
jgi:hypothetical protein